MKATFSMNSAPRLPLPDDLEFFAESCGETPAFYAALKQTIWALMGDYDPAYGRYMADHLENTAAQARGFLKYMGMNEKAADIIADAFSLHDCGKILQDKNIWRITREKRTRTEDEKLERPKHTTLGEFVLHSTLRSMGIKARDEKEEQFLTLCKILMTYHHERADGSGPHGVIFTDRVLSALTIIDHIDGKGKAKGLAASFEDMANRHRDEFDQGMLQAYVDFARGQAGFKITEPVFSPDPRVAKMAVS